MEGTAAEGSFACLVSPWGDAGVDAGTIDHLFAKQTILEKVGAFESYPAALSMKKRDDDLDDEGDWDEGDEDELDDEEDLDEFDDEEDEDDWDDEDEDDEDEDDEDDWDEDLEDEDSEEDEGDLDDED